MLNIHMGNGPGYFRHRYSILEFKETSSEPALKIWDVTDQTIREMSVENKGNIKYN